MNPLITAAATATLGLGLLLNAGQANAQPKFCDHHEDSSTVASEHQPGGTYIAGCAAGNGGTPYHFETVAGKIVRVDGPIDSDMTDGKPTPNP